MIYLEPAQWTSDDDINTYAIQMPTGQYIMDSAGNPWSFASPDNNVLRFEVRQGDHWFDDPATSERSEIGGTTQYPYGAPVNVAYSFMIEPGDPITASWMVLGQLHQNDYDGELHAPPPVSIMMIGEHMAVHIGWTDSAGVDHNQNIYVDPAPIARGQYYSMNISAKFDPSGGGQLTVTRDGQLLATYAGPLGIADHTGVFWKEGIYEAASPETLAVNYKDLSITLPPTVSGASRLPIPPSSAVGVANTYTTGNVVSAQTLFNPDLSQDVYNFNTNGVYYVSSHLHYDPKGKVTQTVDYNANGSRSFAQVLATDGSLLTTYYDGVGTLTKSVKNYASGVISILNYSNSALASRFIQNPDGSSVEFDYDASGAVNKFINIGPDGSKIVRLFGIAGQTYVAQTTTYDASGQITAISRYNADGVMTFNQTITAAGTTTANYSALGAQTSAATNYTDGTVSTAAYAGGALTERRVQYADGSSLDVTYNSAGAVTLQIQVAADGSKQIQRFGITGQTYASETDIYSAGGQLTSLVRANAQGATVFSQQTDASGTTTVEQYTPQGVLTQSVATSVAGVVTTNWFAAAGNVAARQITQPDGSYVYDSYDGSGALTQEIDSIPGVSLTAYNYNSSAGATGATYTKSVTSYQGGLTFASDGVNDTFRSFGDDTFAFTSGFGADVVNNFHTGGANADIIQLSPAIVSNYASLAIRQSGDDTLITVDANDTIRLAGVAASAFSQANVKFAA